MAVYATVANETPNIYQKRETGKGEGTPGRPNARMAVATPWSENGPTTPASGASNLGLTNRLRCFAQHETNFHCVKQGRQPVIQRGVLAFSAFFFLNSPGDPLANVCFCEGVRVSFTYGIFPRRRDSD